MGAYLKIVPQEDMEVLRRYLDSNGVILVPEETLQTLSTRHRDAIQQRGAGAYIDGYNFGGEADIAVDIVACDNHYLHYALADIDGGDDNE